jgi:hypothetical protein
MPPATASKRCSATVMGSTASASMINGGYASNDDKAPRGTLRSWTSTRDDAL